MTCRKRSSLLMVGIGLLVGVGVIVSCIGQGTSWLRAGANNNRFAVQLGEQQRNRKCWVFNHMNKAGGSTVKYMLKPWIKANNVSLGLYDSPQWADGKKFADDYLEANYTLTWGAYTEGLRPHGAQDCDWFTIFRHPIPRLVSAYFYCKKSPGDGLCASRVFKADDNDLLAFAEHWGNFGLRQFSLAFVLPEDMLAAEQHDKCRGDREDNRCPGWYHLKLYLEDLHAAEQAEASTLESKALRDVAMYKLLQPAEELLSKKYAAVGILEKWDTSLLLFNDALQLPNYDWPTGFHEIGKKNGDGTFRTQEEKALLLAWTDPELKKYLWLDLLLYDHAVSVHNRQVAQYGLA